MLFSYGLVFFDSISIPSCKHSITEFFYSEIKGSQNVWANITLRRLNVAVICRKRVAESRRQTLLSLKQLALLHPSGFGYLSGFPIRHLRLNLESCFHGVLNSGLLALVDFDKIDSSFWSQLRLPLKTEKAPSGPSGPVGAFSVSSAIVTPLERIVYDTSANFGGVKNA